MPWKIAPINNKSIIDFIIYIVLVCLIPIAYQLIKESNPAPVKYIYFLVFTTTNIVVDILSYIGTDISYANGNIAELVIVLFSPIFVNKHFFYLVSIGTILKFIIIGIFLKDIVVLIPLILVSIISIVAWILLHRFLDYVSATEASYERQLNGIVKGIIATLELKDLYTKGHSERVANYAAILAKATGKYNKDQLKTFYYACLLHDIGKVNIPDSILTKPGKLTDEEFNIIKTHPIVGANAIHKVEGISEHIEVIEQHHERWDGKGYPYGLKGEEISHLSRITAIADAFDAMTSSRSYRKALPLEVAYDQIVQGKGSQFDPNLVDLFKEIYQDWVDYYKHFNHTQEHE